MPTDQAMLNEAISAARSGDKIRARDLLSRLLRIDKNYPEHWLWMSAVVDSRQEQIYCLQNLLRVDPDNVIAKRGLIMMGALAPDSRLVSPVPPNRRQAWSVTELEIERSRGWRAIMANPTLRGVVYLAAALLTIGLISAGIVGIRIARPATPTPDFAATSAAVGKVITLTPSPTIAPTITPLFRTPTPTPAQPTPLVAYLESTYTPTPQYVNTPHPETEAFHLGLRAQSRQDWEAVIDFMQQTIALNPEAADAYYYLGTAYLESGNPVDALAAFDQAIVLDDLFGAPYLGRAQALLALNPEAEVLEDFNRAISISSDFGVAYLERARYLVSIGQEEAAMEDLIAAENLLPGSPQVPFLRALIAYNLGDYPEALTQAGLAHEGDFTDLATYRLLGRIHLALNQPAEAAEWLKTYLLYEPDDLESLNLLAQAFASSGAFEDALELFDRVIQENRINPDFYLSRAMAYLAIGEAQAALDDLNQANRLRRNDFFIMLALGQALLANDDPGDAYIQLNETLPLAVTDQEKGLVYYYRGLALQAIVSNGDASSLPAAVRDFESALAFSDALPPEIAADAQTQLDLLQPPTPTPTP